MKNPNIYTPVGPSWPTDSKGNKTEMVVYVGRDETHFRLPNGSIEVEYAPKRQSNHKRKEDEEVY